MVIQTCFCQGSFVHDPDDAQFITSDIPKFWDAFDQFHSSKGNPFQAYLDQGSQGLQDFIPYRIEAQEISKRLLTKEKVIAKRLE